MFIAISNSSIFFKNFLFLFMNFYLVLVALTKYRKKSKIMIMMANKGYHLSTMGAVILNIKRYSEGNIKLLAFTPLLF